MANQKGNTGFRNGDLFCFNCGRKYVMNMPQPATIASAIMAQFSKDHAKCLSTWVEPVNNTAEEKSEYENALWWRLYGEHGTSSKVMFNILSQKTVSENMPLTKCAISVYDSAQHPCDPDDFSRCYKLLEAVPQWKGRLNDLKHLSPVWGKLVDNWGTLTQMYEQNQAEQWKNYKQIGMYEFMESLGC